MSCPPYIITLTVDTCTVNRGFLGTEAGGKKIIPIFVVFLSVEQIFKNCYLYKQYVHPLHLDFHITRLKEYRETTYLTNINKYNFTSEITKTCCLLTVLALWEMEGPTLSGLEELQ